MAPQNRTKSPRSKPQKPFQPLSNHDLSEEEKQIARTELEEEKEEEEFGGFDNDNDNDDEEDEDIDMGIEKDESEEELEKLVFGDSAGFKESIRSFSLGGAKVGQEEEEAEDEEAGLENLADADLFFFDSGPSAGAVVPKPTIHAGTEDEEDKPAWEDSDDERIFVSLASVPRLRKLRTTEDEDVVNGREYVRRLRKQYQRLYPTPEWALHTGGKPKKRRPRDVQLGSDEEGISTSADDMEIDEDGDLSAQPLAKLLQDADLLSRTGGGPRKRRKLQSGTIDIQRLKDVTGALPSAITSLSFHPTLPLLLSSGPSSTLYLHHITPNPPNPNPLLTSLHIKHTPLTTTAFQDGPNSSRIFLSARRRFFHVWDLNTGSIEKVTRIYGHQHEQRTMEDFSLSPDGKYMALKGASKKGGGVLNILDGYTLQWIAQVRIESHNGIAGFAWWGDGRGVTIAGKNGEVTEWSLVEQRVLARWNDEGAVGTTTIALGGRSGRDGWIGGDRWVAVGSSAGIVNIYDRREWSGYNASGNTNTAGKAVDDDGEEEETPNLGIPPNPKPTRALDHLTTPVSHLTFSTDGQILAMASRWKKSALRLVHLPSCTVYRNWPTDKTPLGRITAVAWGRPLEGEGREGCEALLSCANEQGKIRLWEIRA